MSSINFNKKTFGFGYINGYSRFYQFSERWLFSTNHKYIGIFIFLIYLFQESFIKFFNSNVLLKKNNLSRFGIFSLLFIVENPNSLNFELASIGKFFVFFLLFLVLCLYFRTNIKNVIFNALNFLYRYKILKSIFHYYFFILISIKGLFEVEFFLLPIIFIGPVGLSLFDMVMVLFEDCNNLLYLGFYFISVGMTFIALDELAAFFVNYINKNPNHFLTKDYLTWFEKKKLGEFSRIYNRGWITTAGKLTAAGQAALYGGTIAVFGGITTATIYAYKSVKNTQIKANATVEAAKVQANATVEAAKVQAEAVKAQANATVEAAKIQAEGAAKAQRLGSKSWWSSK